MPGYLHQSRERMLFVGFRLSDMLAFVALGCRDALCSRRHADQPNSRWAGEGKLQYDVPRVTEPHTE